MENEMEKNKELKEKIKELIKSNGYKGGFLMLLPSTEHIDQVCIRISNSEIKTKDYFVINPKIVKELEKFNYYFSDVTFDKYPPSNKDELYFWFKPKNENI